MNYLKSLQTDTQTEDRMLAFTLTKKTITTTQTAPQVSKNLRTEYTDNIVQLIYSSQVITPKLQITAIKNNH